ncbi:hypothetical protein Leryth_015608 [Lithospermum erythrorhizon]|nr:hypothetical protein Leryth_015608 [Lithospermum erythrorhizon]
MEIVCEQSRFKDDEEKQVQPTLKPSSPPSRVASPQSIASSTNSPSHEFSFTISLPPSSSLSTTTTSTAGDNRTKSSYQSSSSSPFAIDLSPADDIFSHGRLLPLHSISHTPVNIPPRSSTSSIDSFTNPFSNELFYQEKTNNITTTNTFIFEDHQETRQRVKSKSFSLFGLQKWRKSIFAQDSQNVSTGPVTDLEDKNENEDESREKRKLKFDNVSHFLKRYIKMVRPFLSNLRSGNTRDGNMGSFQRQSYSLTGLSLRGSNKKERRGGRRGEYASAPASIWTSPTNSGHLVATPGTTFMSSSSNSSMEELQSAIQAAIAHCKNSISVENNKMKS